MGKNFAVLYCRIVLKKRLEVRGWPIKWEDVSPSIEFWLDNLWPGCSKHVDKSELIAIIDTMEAVVDQCLVMIEGATPPAVR